MACDQWLTRMDTPVALNLGVLPMLFEAYEVTEAKERRWLITDLKCIAAGYLKAVYQEISKKSGNKKV